VPVTVITGFLGSGKTTLLNKILRGTHGLKLAVIENEFGEVGIDKKLVQLQTDTVDEVVELSNGCICCKVRGDLIKAITSILDRRGKAKLDGMIIETSGMADPAPVAQSFLVDDNVRRLSRLDGIVTVVDAYHGLAHMEEVKANGAENESVEQVAFADVILINKVDLVTQEQLKGLKDKIRSINQFAKASALCRANAVTPCDVTCVRTACSSSRRSSPLWMSRR
jgi:G3E family GTPase